jgi:CO/xanthine dehydrogenase FAD-binding subunit
MRSFLPHYSLVAPSSLPEVLALLSMSPPRRPFAGGTDLMVLLEAGTLPEGGYVGLWHLQELRGIKDSGEAIEIGALTTYTEIARHPLLQADWPLLCRAAEDTGGVATQNRGTIGGNIANASPAADTPPALIAYDSELEIVSSRGTRRVPYDRFHTGYKQMDLGADELIARIHLPKRPGSWRQYYRKVGTRRAQAIAKVCMAVACDITAEGLIDDIRIALGSVAPTVVRARAAEAALRGHGLTDATITAAEAALEREIAPIDDIRSNARYRLRVARALLREALRL